MADCQSSWSYIYLHNRRIDGFKMMMDALSPFATFVLRQQARPTAAQRNGTTARPQAASSTVPRQLVIGGIVFIQGEPTAITQFFTSRKLPYYLVYDCATHEPAVIPDALMRPLRQVVEMASERLRFLPRPFHHYLKTHTLVRVAQGPLKGLEGCVVRINRDRRLVMSVGNLTIAISGAHREQFEEVKFTPPDLLHNCLTISAKQASRRLTLLQETIDANLFFPRSQQDVAMYAGNLEILLRKTRNMGSTQAEVITDTLLFLLEEIVYHFDALSQPDRYDLTLVYQAGRQIRAEIARLTAPASQRLSPAEQDRLLTLSDALILNHSYLFPEA